MRFADLSMEVVAYHAIRAATDLAAERGRYPSFGGSLWSRDILPIDSIAQLEEGRGSTLDWGGLRAWVRTVEMRNSNCMAIAPTATTSNIAGISQSIEPTYQNLFVKSNLSGKFTGVNPYLVRGLKERGLWDPVMVNDLKYYDGPVQAINRIPKMLKELCATAFEIDPRWVVEAAGRRQNGSTRPRASTSKCANRTGRNWTTSTSWPGCRDSRPPNYLRSMGATHLKKSSMEDAAKASQLNAVGGDYPSDKGNGADEVQACSILEPDCESCQ